MYANDQNKYLYQQGQINRRFLLSANMEKLNELIGCKNIKFLLSNFEVYIK